MIILKPNTQEPVAAVKYNPARITSGLLYNKIKNGLLLQEPLTQTEKVDVSAIARHLIKYGYISINTNKLNWILQILDETFNIRVKVEHRTDGYFLSKK